MPDSPVKKTKTKKTAWIAGGAAALVAAVIAWRVHQANTAAAAAATGTTDGQTTPAPNTAAAAPQMPTSLPSWIQTALGGSYTTATYSPPQLLNDINSWLGGQCVSQAGYNVIGNLVETLGVPPGYQTAPSLMVCPSATTGTGTGTTTAAKPASVTSGMQTILNEEIGTLSDITGHNATQSQVAQWYANAEKMGLTGVAKWEYIQSQNVGAVSSGLRWPSHTSISQLAATLAGGPAAFAALDSQGQQYYAQQANVQLLEQLNGTGKTAQPVHAA